MTTPNFTLEADLRGQYWEPDRRESRRRRFTVGSFGYLTASHDHAPEEVWLSDLSESGIAFFSGWPMTKGSVVIIKLARRDGEPVELAAKVVHATRCNTREWLIGCEFAKPLQEDDVEQLL